LTPQSHGGGFARVIDNATARITIDEQSQQSTISFSIVSVGSVQAPIVIGDHLEILAEYSFDGLSSRLSITVNGSTVESYFSNESPDSGFDPIFIGTHALSPGGLLYKGFLGPIVFEPF
jgi:hypothetical protein